MPYDHATKAPRFSIIMPHFDGTVSNDLLMRGLGSLAAQTNRDFEVLLYHDGPLSRPLPDLRSVPLPSLQVTVTPQRYNDWGHSLRDLGIRAAKGDYILHFNADNLLYPKALETLDRFSRWPLEPMSEPEMQENPDVLIFPLVLRGVHISSAGLRRSRSPNHMVILSGLPPLKNWIDCMQLVATRQIWLDIGGWYDKRESSDGLIYEELLRRFGGRYVPSILGEHW